MIGTLEQTDTTHIKPQTILFTNNPKIIQKEKDNLVYCGTHEQDVLYINERQVIVRSKDMYRQTRNVAAEGIYADVANRFVIVCLCVYVCVCMCVFVAIAMCLSVHFVSVCLCVC